MAAGHRRTIRAGVVECVRLFPRVSRPLTVALVALLLAAASLPVTFKVVSGALVGAIPEAAGSGAGDDRVVALAVVLGIVFAGQQLLGPMVVGVSDALGRRVTGHLRNRVMRAAVAPPGVAHLEDPGVLDLVTQAQTIGTTGVTPQALVGSIVNKATMYLTGAGSAFLLASYRWWLAAVQVGGYLLMTGLLRREVFRTAEVVMDQTQVLRRSMYFRDLALTPLAAKETRVFGLGEWVVDRFRRSWLAAMTEAWRRRRDSWRLVVLTPLVWFAIDTLVYVMLGRSAIRGEISLGELAVYSQAALATAGLVSVGQDDFHLRFGTPPVLAVGELDRTVRAPAQQLPGSSPVPPGAPRDAIRFEAVSFRYAGRDTDVFTELDLVVPAERSLAVVGANGAGKTTLVKLLARLYDPSAGRLTVDGVDLRELDAARWQGRIGAIFQDYTRYEMTAADNVGFGAIDRDALDRAAARAGALDLVQGLDSGWDTVLSRQFRGGTDLSGGQWQRLALARALYAVERGASILILDEPAANLDVRAEAALYDRFLELTEGLTTVLISHRFSTVRRVDRIVVLEHGRVVESGTHDDLVAHGGRYARMYGLQAARFDA